MAYQINRFNRSLLTTVEDGTLDETTDIKFVGKNYAGYGEVHNENFLFLLENFSGANEPPKPVSGQLWFDTGSQRMKFRDSNNKWRTVGGAEVSGNQPAGLATGDFWWDSANEQLYVYNGSEFVLIGPQDAGDGITQMVSRLIVDTNDVSRSVIVAYINDSAVYMISPHDPFTIKDVVGNTIDGFGLVSKGLTLRDTNNTAGITSTSYRFHGTATNADRLGGFTASDFATATDPEFDQMFANRVVIDDVFILDTRAGSAPTEPNYAVITNESAPGNDIRFETKNSQGTLTTSVKIMHDGVYPIQDGAIDLGSSLLSFGSVHADSFVGTSTAANTLRVGNSGTTYTYATELNVAQTVVIRDESNTITADVFNGVATQARFADLAEKYTVEYDHPVGTVMSVSTEPGYEIWPCRLNDIPVGVISEKPAYLMNKDLDNAQAIALEGRVPVRVVGKVRKGDKLHVDQGGVASLTYTGNPFVGIALESNDDESEKLVEVILKL